MHLTEEEKADIEQGAKGELSKISEERNRVLDDLHTRQRTVLADIDYLTQNKITLLRTGSMNAEEIMQEQKRLEDKLASVNIEISAYSESAPEMMKFVLTFSELVKDAGIYFKYALDGEKREIIHDGLYRTHFQGSPTGRL